MTEIPIVVSDDVVTVGGYTNQVELQLSVGATGERGSRIFTGSVDPTTLPTDSPIWGGYTDFKSGDIYLQRDTDLLAVWEWLYASGEYTWVRTVNDIGGAGGSVTLDADLDAIADLTGTGLARRTAPNTWTLDTTAYLTSNQTITLSGDVSGSGTTSIVTTVADDSHSHTGATIYAIGRSKIAGTALTSDSTGVFNVLDYGATGDGVTDDTAAIEAAILAAGEGGVVLFPPGNYGVASPLTPLAGQRWEGTHSPTWDASDDLEAGCSIDALPGFSGASLIAWADTSPGVLFTYLCFNGLGDEHGTTLHGFHLGGDTGGERGWTIRDCTIHGFSGYGLTGRLHVIDLRDSHISRCGWGLRVVGNQALHDSRIIGCQIYMNRYGGIGLDGDYRSGAASIIGTRVERSGGTPYDPDNPRVAYAPGIRLTNATNINVLAVNTDANTGPGFEVAADPDNDLRVHAIQVTGCGFARDGGGDQVAPQIPAIKLVNARFVNITATAVTWGKANDSGGSGPLTPYHALWVEDSWFCHVANSWLEAETSANSLHLVGDNYRSSVSGSIESEIDATSFISDTAAPTNPMPGQWYWSTSTNEAKFYDGTEWVRADGTTGGDNSRLALWDDGSGDKRIVFQSDDLDLWTIAVQSDANGQGLTVQRMDALGDYLDTPVYIDHDSGMLFVDPVWIAGGTASQVPLTVRHGGTSPTVSYVNVTDSDGNAKFQVLWDGTLRSNWGSSGYRMTQLGSTQIVREGASGSQTMIGAYTSVANANAGSPVFEVQADGSVWSNYVLGSGDGGKYLTPKAYVDGIKTSLKAEVAASTDFADFQSRIASW